MSREFALAESDEVSVQDFALGILERELNEITDISLSLSKSLGFLKSRLKTPFPKTCSKCNLVYPAFEDFFYGTDEISRGTVSYPVLGNDFYLHRNCKSPCETTLVVVFVDRRDESAAGTRRRELCEICIEILQKRLQLEESVARDLLLSILANKLIPTHQSKS